MLLDFADGSPSLAQYADIGGLNRIGMEDFIYFRFFVWGVKPITVYRINSIFVSFHGFGYLGLFSMSGFILVL